MDNVQIFELLQKISQRNEGAFRELYQAYSRKVYAYVLNQVKDSSRAEEIVADSLYELWRNPLAFRGESQFSSWVIGIARHKVLSSFRAHKGDSDHEDVDEMDEMLESDAPAPDEELAQKQHRDGVRQCMDKLPAEQRECMHLVFYEGYSLAEVAEIQDCPEGTVKTRLFHARQKLKTCLRLLLERERA
jgi:RNA polymerase sigma-70 factor, ECF subfamily